MQGMFKSVSFHKKKKIKVIYFANYRKLKMYRRLKEKNKKPFSFPPIPSVLLFTGNHY